MTRYVIRRILQAIPLLIIISAILFILANEMGDPLASFGGRRRIRSADRERLTRQLGLDKPVLVQYAIWLVGNDWMQIDVDGDGTPDEYGKRRGVLRGDFGTSFMEKRPVLEIIGERFKNTMILMYVFAVNFKRWGLPYFPTVGMYDLAVGPTLPQIAWHLVLPVATIAIISIAGYSRYVRSQMLEVINQDYIRTAHSKGLPDRWVLTRHALKNAALPLITIIGMDLPLLIAGATVTESIFAWPGMGRLYWDATQDTDIPILMGILVIISVLVIVFQIITDITYTYLDPRIRYE